MVPDISPGFLREQYEQPVVVSILAEACCVFLPGRRLPCVPDVALTPRALPLRLGSQDR